MDHAKRLLLSLFSLVLVCFAGCAGGESSKQLQRSQVSGFVKLDGAHVEGVTVWFVPRTGTPGNGAVGATDATGMYILEEIGGESGVLPGQYDVVFSKFAMPDGSSPPADVQPESVGAKQVLPAQYTDASTTEIKANVKEPEQMIDFALQSR